MTAQGHPRATFQRAIERGNLLVAETVLREIGRVSLVEALQLTALIAVKDPRRHARVSARCLGRYLETHEAATIDECAHVVGALVALGGNGHDAAYSALLDMADRASRRSVSHGVACTGAEVGAAPGRSAKRPAPLRLTNGDGHGRIPQVYARRLGVMCPRDYWVESSPPPGAILRRSRPKNGSCEPSSSGRRLARFTSAATRAAWSKLHQYDEPKAATSIGSGEDTC